MVFLIVTSNHSSIFFTPICWPQNLHRKIGRPEISTFIVSPFIRTRNWYCVTYRCPTSTDDSHIERWSTKKNQGLPKQNTGTFQKVNFKKRGARSGARKGIFWFWKSRGRMDGLTNHQQDSWCNPTWESCLELCDDLVYLKWKHINHHRSKSLFPKCLLLYKYQPLGDLCFRIV